MSAVAEESENLREAGRREQLQGWIPPLASEAEIRDALEKAFDYRGDVTLTLRNGEIVEGYIFDRLADVMSLDRCVVRLMPRDGSEKISVRYSEIARLEFSGRDAAEGKSFEAWVRKFNERKKLQGG